MVAGLAFRTCAAQGHLHCLTSVRFMQSREILPAPPLSSVAGAVLVSLVASVTGSPAPATRETCNFSLPDVICPACVLSYSSVWPAPLRRALLQRFRAHVSLAPR